MERRGFLAALPLAFVGTVTGRFSTKQPNQAGLPFVAQDRDGQLYAAVMEPIDSLPAGSKVGIVVNESGMVDVHGKDLVLRPLK